MLAAADIEVFTYTTTFQIMQSLRLDNGCLQLQLGAGRRQRADRGSRSPRGLEIIGASGGPTLTGIGTSLALMGRTD